MKVLHLITKSNWGGAQRHVYDLAIDTRDAGHEVSVALGGEGLLAEKLRDAGIRTVPLQSLGRDVRVRGDAAAALEIWRTIDGERPDVLHLHSSKAGGVGALIGRLRRVPVVVFTAHGWAFNENRPAWQRATIRLLHLFTVLLAHRTIAVAPAIPRQLGFNALVGRKFSVVPNGVSPQTLSTRAEARRIIAERSPAAAEVIANAGSGLLVGTLAELHPIKGIDTLIEAAAILDRRNPMPKFSFVVLGEGSEREPLQRLIDSKNLTSRFALAGFADSAPRLLSAFNIFAMPSRSEAMPMALLEAGSAKLAVVATRVGGIPEAIRNMETGLLVSPDKPRELAEALRRLEEEPNLRKKLGDALEVTVSRNFSRDAMSTATVALYREALRQNG